MWKVNDLPSKKEEAILTQITVMPQELTEPLQITGPQQSIFSLLAPRNLHKPTLLAFTHTVVLDLDKDTEAL